MKMVMSEWILKERKKSQFLLKFARICDDNLSIQKSLTIFLMCSYVPDGPSASSENSPWNAPAPMNSLGFFRSLPDDF